MSSLIRETHSDKRFILVSRKTRLQELVEKFNTWPQAKFYLEHNNIDAMDYLVEHDTYKSCLQQAERILKPLARFQALDRDFLPNYQFSTQDVVVVIGQDGLVANTLKYLNGQALIAINPDPQRFDGKLLPFEMADLLNVVKDTLAQKRQQKLITFAKAQTNDGQTMLAVNDIFVGPKSHTSARYKLIWQGEEELQSSSGVIISTGFGSSGWLQSIITGAMSVSGQKHNQLAAGFNWQDKRLQFSVREPFPSQSTGTTLTFGKIDEKSPLVIESAMPENGVIFSDGIEADYLNFNSGSTVTITVADIQGALVI
ncbi:MAG: hypothetical protein MJK11_09705 [Pseudomonadales bacterium]|nr:hypothetical protein [Pseudomonadales bacterium]